MDTKRKAREALNALPVLLGAREGSLADAFAAIGRLAEELDEPGDLSLEGRLQDLLARGWRVHLKTHAVPLGMVSAFRSDPDRFQVRDLDGDGIGWTADGFSFGLKRQGLHKDDRWRKAGVHPTIEEAMDDLVRQIDQVDPPELEKEVAIRPQQWTPDHGDLLQGEPT